MSTVNECCIDLPLDHTVLKVFAEFSRCYMSSIKNIHGH